MNRLQLLVYANRILRFFHEKKVVDLPSFEKLRKEFYHELWQKTASEMGAGIEHFGNGYYKISVNNTHTYVMNSKVMLDNHLTMRMAGNKPLVNKIFSDLKIPATKHVSYSIDQIDKAYRFLRKSSKTCVVKPASGGAAGKGITTNISTIRQLKKASVLAATFSAQLLIEEQIQGYSYRMLYLGGKLLDTIIRKPPTITGDGSHSIKELIRSENRQRLEGKPIKALSPLTVDYECKLYLRKQGKNINSIPDKNEKVTLKTVCNQNTSNENASISDRIHPSILYLGEKIANAFRLDLVGIDLITEDIQKPLEKSGGAINEINTNPGLHHHYLIDNSEQGIPVAENITAYVLLKNSGLKTTCVKQSARGT